jgi:regulator of sigma E protease
MDFIIQASQFLLSLSLLIILHEFGHFIPAKLFKTKVEKFYLFFDPYFSLFKKKIGGTEYGIGWLPLGGYVKIAGMVDESMDTEALKEEPKPWEFRSKPAWQRLIIMLGGVTVNVILAVVIYSGMMMYYGEAILPIENLKDGVMVDSKGEAIGLQHGDRVVSVDGKKLTRYTEIPKEILLGENEIGIIREGKAISLEIKDEHKKLILVGESPIVGLRFPYLIGSFTDTSTAGPAGLLVGDSVVGVNGESLYYFDEFVTRIPKSAGDTITLNVYREGKPLDFKVPVPLHGKIGITPGGPAPLSYYDIETLHYGFVDALPAGIQKAKTVLKDYIRQFKLILNPKTEAYKQVGGFIAIGSQFSTTWDWERFWSFTAFLSIMLAFLNILPIPALDGGHVVFVLIEMISGRKPSDKVLEYAQMVGFFILLALIVLANGNDILNLFTGD